MQWVAPSAKDTATETLEKSLWDAADQLRANSGLSSQQYSGPVLGLIFLRFAEMRFAKRRSELEQESAAIFASSDSRLRGPGLNGDLSWSGVLMKLSARLLATASPHRVTPAVAATQHCLKPGCGPGLWKNFRFGLSPNFFDTSLGLRPRKSGFKFAQSTPRWIFARSDFVSVCRNRHWHSEPDHLPSGNQKRFWRSRGKRGTFG